MRGSILPPFPMDGMIATDPFCVSINGWQGSIQQDINFMPHFQILSHSFKRSLYKKICNSKRHF